MRAGGEEVVGVGVGGVGIGGSGGDGVGGGGSGGEETMLSDGGVSGICWCWC